MEFDDAVYAIPDPVEGWTMIDLCLHPRWRAEDLGKPIPDSAHAVSVALPLWEHVEKYEEGDPEVMEALACGYPRFIHHPAVQRLFRACEERFAREGEACVAFPSRASALRCVAFVGEKASIKGRISAFGMNGVHAAAFPREVLKPTKDFWQHTGELVSSRLAEAVLAGRGPCQEGENAKRVLRERIGALAGEHEDNVFLFPSGMAALSQARRLLEERSGRLKSVQLGFPYVDLLKLQNEVGPGAHFFPGVKEADLDSLAELLVREPVSGVFCEFPGNPLLECVNVPRLGELLKNHDVPLVVDETLGTYINVELFPYADVIATSLTKYFSGVGDVMGGALILNSRSPFHGAFQDALRHDYEDLLWGEDAEVLEKNSRDFPERMKRINDTAETVCDALARHPAVATIYYPKYGTHENYRALLKNGGKFGGLFSLLLNDAAKTSRPFFDALRVSKGPNLGTNYTLACPYMLLAHYNELEWAEACGVSRYLVRVSIGLEEPEDLLERFEEALGAVTAS